MNRRISTRGILYKNGKLLAVQQKLNVDKNFFNTIGGGLEDNENLRAGLNREFIEETGVKPKIGDLLFIQQFSEIVKGEKREYLEFFFNILNVDDFHNIDTTKTSHGMIEIENFKWVSPKEENILPKFLTEVDIEKSIEEGKVQVFEYLK